MIASFVEEKCQDILTLQIFKAQNELTVETHNLKLLRITLFFFFNLKTRKILTFIFIRRKNSIDKSMSFPIIHIFF